MKLLPLLATLALATSVLHPSSADARSSHREGALANRRHTAKRGRLVDVGQPPRFIKASLKTKGRRNSVAAGQFDEAPSQQPGPVESKSDQKEDQLKKSNDKGMEDKKQASGEKQKSGHGDYKGKDNPQQKQDENAMPATNVMKDGRSAVAENLKASQASSQAMMLDVSMTASDAAASTAASPPTSSSSTAIAEQTLYPSMAQGMSTMAVSGVMDTAAMSDVAATEAAANSADAMVMASMLSNESASAPPYMPPATDSPPQESAAMTTGTGMDSMGAAASPVSDSASLSSSSSMYQAADATLSSSAAMGTDSAASMETSALTATETAMSTVAASTSMSAAAAEATGSASSNSSGCAATAGSLELDLVILNFANLLE